MKTQSFSMELGGKTLTAEFTDLAMQANGSVIVRYGNTAVLATAVMGSQEREGLDYFPLTVDYEEKFYAAGQILGSRFMRREGRPSDEAVLSGRAVDRTVRPLFDQRMRVEVQVVITILSLGEDDPDSLAVIAASLALGTSDIPWAGPVGAVRVARTVEGSSVVSPSYETRESATLDLLACGKGDLINMIEVGAHQVEESVVEDALAQALAEIQTIEKFQKDIIEKIGKEKRVYTFPELSADAKTLFDAEIAPKLKDALFTNTSGKKLVGELHDAWRALLKEKELEENKGLVDAYFEEKIEAVFDTTILEEGRRPDGRGFDEVRELFAQAGNIAPMLHGVGVFYRGETHVLSALTLGGPEDTQIIDGMEAQEKKRFMHHYNFPPFSTGETGRMGGTNRRMIGHGALAEKAVGAVIPPKESFPYTIRIVSEVMSSNGSSSMASVCGSTLALMDAGVPIVAPVAGIAMGLVLDEKGAYKILTDIQGPEDHYGDMDFKVAGTKNGVTAVQMDVKVNGVPLAVLKEGFVKARDARLHILKTITEAIPEPRKELSPMAPRVLITKIKKEFIGLVIGSGGKTVNQIREITGAEISLEEDGTVFITGKTEGAQEAQRLVELIAREYKVGERFDAVVTRVTDFGAFARLGEDIPIEGMKETEGLVHISEIAPFRIASVEGVIKEGDIVPVIIKEIDDMGKVRLSIKDVDPEFAEKKGIKPAAPGEGGGMGGGFRPRFGGHDRGGPHRGGSGRR